ncbi:MAG: hypothetical protein CBC42_03490 [Betaproteobacteria bacterium TMED82]|nr:MAG: hypothetical protein CBC42_03490 [Betaproteobacteria bacterium TMED82]
MQNTLKVLAKLVLSGVIFFFVLASVALGSTILWLGPEVEKFLNNSVKLNSVIPKTLRKSHSLKLENAKLNWNKWLLPSIEIDSVSIKNLSGSEILFEGLEAQPGFLAIAAIFERKFTLDDVVVSKLTVDVDVIRSLRSSFLKSNILQINSSDNMAWFRSIKYEGRLQVDEVAIVFKENTKGSLSRTLEFDLLNLFADDEYLSLSLQNLNLKDLRHLYSYNIPSAVNNFDVGGKVRSAELQFPIKHLEGFITGKIEFLEIAEFSASFEDVSYEENIKMIKISPLKGRLFNVKNSIFLEFKGEEVTFSAENYIAGSHAYFSELFGVLEISNFKIEDFLLKEITTKFIKLRNLEAKNPVFKINASGEWYEQNSISQLVDITGTLSVFSPEAIGPYLPKAMGPRTRGWITRSIKIGDELRGNFEVKGDVTENASKSIRDNLTFAMKFFPENLHLKFSKKWPVINNVQGIVKIEGNSLVLSGLTGDFLGNKVVGVDGEIPDIFSTIPILNLRGNIEGKLQNLVNISNNSPVNRWLGNLTETVLASGESDLKLDIKLNLLNLRKSNVKAELRFYDNSLSFSENSPEMTKVEGVLSIVQKRISHADLKGELLGGAVEIVNAKANGKNLPISFRASGELHIRELRRWLSSSKRYDDDKFIHGKTDYDLLISGTTEKITVSGGSNLMGVAINAPGSFAKNLKSTREVKLSFGHKRKTSGITSLVQDLSIIIPDYSLEFMVFRKIVVDAGSRMYKSSGSTKYSLRVGGSPKKDISKEKIVSQASNIIDLKLFKADVKEWVNVLLSQQNSFDGVLNNKESLGSTEIKLRIQEITCDKYNFSDANGIFFGDASGWSGDFDAVEIGGFLNWFAGDRKFEIKLARLHLKPSEDEKQKLRNAINVFDKLKFDDVVNVTVEVEDFRRASKHFGRMELDVSYLNDNEYWKINRLMILSKNTRLDASGLWKKNKPESKPRDLTDLSNKSQWNTSRTDFNFRLDTKDSGVFLEKFGYPGILESGGGLLSGQLSWSGTPLDFSIVKSSGDLSLDIDDGKFLKVDPGLARLVGVFNIQSLPKRIKLDFEDIFSQGFSFDKLRGNLRLSDGKATTENLRVVGTQATIFLEGDVSLSEKTQNVRLLMLPELNAGIASLGYVLVNPAVGLGSFLAQYILRDPLRKVMAIEYQVTGPWDSPTIQKKSLNSEATLN